MEGDLPYDKKPNSSDGEEEERGVEGVEGRQEGKKRKRKECRALTSPQQKLHLAASLIEYHG